MDTTQQSPVILSLCTGMLRGLEVGIERALERPVKIAAYAEIEAFAVANLIAGMEAGVLAPAPVWTDLKTFPYRQFRGKVHGIIGGYPCQPFSVAGNQKGTDDPRHLWPFIKEGIKEVQPQFCFFENVRGHLKLGFEQVYNDLRELGYDVRFGIYSAEEVGAPHKRERLFILAVENSYCQSMRNDFGGVYREASPTSPKMDDASSNRHKSDNQIQTGRNGIEPSGKGSKMAIATSTRFSFPGFRRIRQLPKEERKRIHNRLKQSGYELANSICVNGRLSESKKWNKNIQASRGCISLDYSKIKRLEKQRYRTFRSKQAYSMPSRNGHERELADSNGIRLGTESDRVRKPGLISEAYAFPERPGEQQYDWEEARIVESGLGCTINGYNFREDLLRGIGNGVVEQTAAKAFVDLLSKF